MSRTGFLKRKTIIYFRPGISMLLEAVLKAIYCYWAVVKENAVCIASTKQGAQAVNVQKTKLPDRFLGRVF